ncbi:MULTISPECIES: peptidoglycan DD-metalloendopeptidase family protein [Helicobacter]|uniref:peptidoglycan DD-metalloendopeptidase family protein n=1 Tax=Helicobacter TaxID=209 RepID=UPI00202B8711|nr:MULTISPECIES: peptidoglycan DD-metalloendopeptidase family protein [Helicobacter]MCI7047364.1 peptidoglycan DD-metalloendopeptidase family protein [Helicobacter sp.]MCL9821206.1 peptidoglycan DD-metalloendopeptidase family protein [Helicobacter colisuis]
MSSLVAANIQESQWENGQTLLTFFEKNSIPLKVYYDLPREDKELADEIVSGNTFYTLYDEEGKLLQALIPINENSQLHIYKEDATYGMRAIPIVYFEKEHNIALSVESSLYNDIVKYTGDTFLASDFIQAYKGSVNFKRQIKKGDKLAIIYERKYRLGKVFGSPNIKASILKTSNEKKYVVRFDDGNFYDLEGNNLNKYLFMIPLKYKRISSHFSMGRKHPILGYKRPHLGTDYAAPRHTPIKAASQGKVIFAGTKGGYGKTVIIQHENGYRTLYGHMHKINKGIRAGVYVSQGKQIGTVGSTGLSTGPHLHFGLYKNGSAINPQKHLRIATIKLKDKEKEKFSILAKSFQNQLETILANNLENEPFKKMQNSYIVYLSEEIGNDEDSKRNN